MSLKVIDDSEKVALGPSQDGTYTEANGGTEMMNRALYERVDKDLLDQFFIIKSRVRHVDENKKNILWLHDLVADPEVQHLADEKSRARFEKLVFVSNYQMGTYNMGLGVPYTGSIVLKNAIDPITSVKKDDDQIRLIYHTTPHRGLQILIPVMEKLAEHFGDKIHLDIFSSFEAYGWKERDKPYEELFERARQHPQMTYHGYQPNNVVREALQKAHIFAYPSIWVETSCIAAIEAMSAGCEIVCPNLGALPETTGNFATMYQYQENGNDHATTFANILARSIIQRLDENSISRLQFQKAWADASYNWDNRAAEWTHMLQGLLK